MSERKAFEREIVPVGVLDYVEYMPEHDVYRVKPGKLRPFGVASNYVEEINIAWQAWKAAKDHSVAKTVDKIVMLAAAALFLIIYMVAK